MRTEALAAEYDDAKKKVADLTEKFKESAKRTGTTSEETRKLAKELDTAEKEASDAKKDLDAYSGSVKKAGNESNSASPKIGNFLKGVGKAAVAGITAATVAIGALTVQSVNAYGEYEQLAGGVKKIFDKMDNSKIFDDAANAYVNLNMSANEYLATINSVGATFASTMGDAAGYETAKRGMQAISDFASGTGASLDELNEKYKMITRSTSSYQSIADQFSGILPATSADFLKQAQAAGLLSKKYTKLTAVPLAEYQAAVTAMLEKGVAALGLTGNTADEARKTMTGSLAMISAAWQNLVAQMANDSANLDLLMNNLVDAASAVVSNFLPRIETVLGSIGKLIQGIAPIIVEQLPSLLQSILPSLVGAIRSLLDSAYAVLPSLLQVLIDDAVPLLIESNIEMTDSLIGSLPSLLPLLIDGISRLAIKIAQQLPSATESILDYLPEILISISKALLSNVPILLQALFELMGALVLALPEAAVGLILAVPEILADMAKALVESVPIFIQGWVDIFEKVKLAFDDYMLKLEEGIKDLWAKITGKTKEGGENTKNAAAKSFSETLEISRQNAEQMRAQRAEKWQQMKDDASASLTAMKNSITQNFETMKANSKASADKMRANIAAAWEQTKQNTANSFAAIKNSAVNAANNINNAVSTAWQNMKNNMINAFSNMRAKAAEIFNALKNAIRTPINGIIGFINRLISGIVQGINAMIRALNKLKFNVPSWVPSIGGKSFGFNLKTVSAPSIPYLAKGAVIPPRSEFLAVLGDQRQGTNIETPEALLRKIFREEISRSSSGGNSNYRFTAQLNRRTLFDELIEEAKLIQMSSGRNPFELA